ncbi:hypothetical protein GCM10009753_19150 [Streptantibioticus ferralitis]|uniref:Immunity protein 35 domain-containing protein n=1 Tax=Streptantibioticus ferralitis TaxID=236510 RepID=A0ABT5YSC4_9ACTN|nr:hypothetical protein [Streptantibioticus ferralitis]MDF2254358.1 hypothetical protein [Streptantibioticus ferralitis]
MSRSLTVGQLIRQLEEMDADLPVRLAVNPDWPFSHYAGRVLNADGTAFIAEDGQEGYLPRTVSTLLDWEASTPTDVTDSDEATEYLDTQNAAYIVTELFDRPDWTVDDDGLPATYSGPVATSTPVSTKTVGSTKRARSPWPIPSGTPTSRAPYRRTRSGLSPLPY